MKQFMPDLTPTERRRILEQNADKVEISTYQKPLTDEALNEKMKVLSKNSIELYDLEEEKKDAVAVFKEKIDPLKKSNKHLLNEIRTKQETVSGKLYMLANYEDKMMETYDEEGLLVESRRLKPDENQANLMRVAN